MRVAKCADAFVEHGKPDGLPETAEQQEMHVHLQFMQPARHLLPVHRVSFEEPRAARLLFPAGGGAYLRSQF
jgi:hypothetical protein